MNRHDVGVFYLVRESNSVELTKRFAQSYLHYPSGVDHTLTLICKGFQDRHLIEEHHSQFGKIPLSVIEMPDVGYDIGSYRCAVDSFECGYYCFLNSYSVISGPAWLKSLVDCAADPKVGLVGATGSYESISSGYMTGITVGSSNLLMVSPGIPRAIWNLMYFPWFPNPHIRTNGFMLRNDILRKVAWPRKPSRAQALRFESGRQSLTRQVLSLGLEVLIVGRDGRSYNIPEWQSSKTFRQKDQSNILIADNRTIEYSWAEHEVRARLSIEAWGSAL